jgi:hypothetical protein
MAGTIKSLYETDFAEWSDHTAALVRAGRFDEVDTEHLAEEIQDLGEEVRRAVRSQTKRLLMHRLKQILQPERDGPGWHASIMNARGEILDAIEDVPSLKRHLNVSLDLVYRRAVRDARAETNRFCYFLEKYASRHCQGIRV